MIARHLRALKYFKVMRQVVKVRTGNDIVQNVLILRCKVYVSGCVIISNNIVMLKNNIFKFDIAIYVNVNIVVNDLFVKVS